MSPAPTLGKKVFDNPNSNLDSATEDLLHAPQAEDLGTISKEALARAIPPAPWEVDPKYDRHDSDARKFVEASPEYMFRWLNPKLVSQTGLRYWQAVPAKGDGRFKLKLKSLAAPDNTIRRGDHSGDFLAWMYTSWYESKVRMKRERAQRQTQKAVNEHAAVQEAMARGKFGRYVQPVPGHHPTHTQADGRTMPD